VLCSIVALSADMFLDKKHKKIRNCSHYQNNNCPNRKIGKKLF